MVLVFAVFCNQICSDLKLYAGSKSVFICFRTGSGPHEIRHYNFFLNPKPIPVVHFADT